MLRAVEHIVGAYLDNPSAAFLYGSGKIRRCNGIERSAQFLVALGLVNRCVSRAVDYSVNLLLGHHLLYGQLVGDVEFLNVGINPVVLRMLSLQALHFVS